ncbi:MAG: hypothetical protein AAGF99_03090 [Bacteroidota bacterium]
MQAILDHLSAVVVGTILLVALLTLQIREKLDATDQALQYQLRSRAETLLDTFGRDIDNMMTQEEAIAAGVSPSTCKVHYAGGRLRAFWFPSYVERVKVVGTNVDGGPQYESFYEPMSVRYNVNWTPRTITAGDSTRSVYRLVRREYRAGVGGNIAATAAAEVEIGTIIESNSIRLSEPVTDFNVQLFGAAGRLSSRGVESGFAPSDVAYLRLSAELAHDALANLATDQQSQRLVNLARVSQTFRPPDLVYSN